MGRASDFAQDRLLVLGPDAAEPTFHWTASLWGYGIMTSRAVGRLVADRIRGMNQAG